MKFTLSFVCIIFLKLIESHDSESSEMNRIEISPFYDTIIISDVADIINEFENNMNSPLDAILNSESESDENIEDLLTEYQISLDKAHKQRLTYLENKNKSKNKVPLFRHEKFFKGKTPNVKHDNYYFNSFLNPFKPTRNNFDLYVPLTPNEKLLNKPLGDLRKEPAPQFSAIDKIIKNKFLPINFQSTSLFNPDMELMKPRCCKNGQGNCKQCPTVFNAFTEKRTDPKVLIFDKTSSDIQQDPAHPGNNFMNNELANDLENTINLKIKVDVQLPSLMNMRKSYKGRYRERNIDPEDTYSKEFMSSINLPIPYFNFPIPLDLIHKKSPKFFKHDNIHEITIHKKKKSRNNSNKKHRNKIISFQKISSDLPHINNITVENITSSNDNVYSTSENINNHLNTISKLIEDHTKNNNTKVQSVKEKNNNDQILESIFVTVNISNEESDKEEANKTIENSIETDYTKAHGLNITTEKTLLRKRRHIQSRNITVNTNSTVIGLQNVTILNSTSKKGIEKVVEQTISKKIEKSMLADAEMLFWPTLPQNRSVPIPNNITNLILERESKKEKLNMSTDTIRHNRTLALEHAIFGNVDWDDISVVAPTFLSFVGKYIRGALTFCSEKICHSMKCEEKKCTHRICVPEDRLNQKGHCTGSNTTDSIASLESIMDLPSSVVFKIVDIVEDKMLGKVFGKVTLCTNAKCLTFLASKKTFLKYRCNIKESNSTGHCPNIKNEKIM